jgi:hypothetical protein
MPRFPYAVSLLALLIGPACKDGGGGGPIEASPASLDFGSVDFQGPPLNCDPDEGGCAPDGAGPHERERRHDQPLGALWL